MPKGRAVHYRNSRLYVNAGMAVAECIARRDGPLDTEAPENERTTGKAADVTCRACLAAMRKAKP